MPGGSFFQELRQRKVLQAAAIYGAVAWGVTEVVVTIVEQLSLPRWISTLAVIGFIVGFPVAMFLAWTFDITAAGIRRTTVASRRGKASLVVSMLLLVAGTAGLFLLIWPSLEHTERGAVGTEDPVPILANSIAVLPFGSAGQDPEDSWLIEGLSDQLRDQLARMPDIRVAARSSSVAARRQQLDARAISDKLGVAHLVEGSLRRQGNRLRVSVQLIEGRTGLARWSETYLRGPGELLNVQQAIAEEVVSLVLPGAAAAMAGPATRNINANELMLLARHYEQQVRDRQVVDVDTLLEAVRLYREATEADPDSALAHSRLAGALLYLGDIDAAEAPIFRALSLGPNLSEVQNTLGEFYWTRGMPQAAPAFARAVELNPNNADALHNYANWLTLTSAGFEGVKADQPAKLLRRALKVDPLSLSRHAALGEYFGKFGRADEVRQVIRGIQELFRDAESCRVVAWLYELIGELDRAIAWTLRARNLEPDNPDHAAYLAQLYVSIGDIDAALRLEPDPDIGLLFQMRRYPELIDVAELHMIEAPDDVEVRYLLAFAYVAAGQFESAIHVLSATGLPDSLLNDRVRSTLELEGFTTLMNALAASALPETATLAQELARWYEDDTPWWGDAGWVALFRACNRALLGRDEQALEILPDIKASPRLRRDPLLWDSWCLKRYAEEPVYLDVLRDQEERKAALRERLPATLAEFGVSL